MRNNWLIFFLDESKVTGEIRGIAWVMSLGKFVLYNASWCQNFQVIKQQSYGYDCLPDTNKETGNSPFVCEPRQSSHVKDKLCAFIEHDTTMCC